MSDADDATEDDEGEIGDRLDGHLVQKTKSTIYVRCAKVIGKPKHMVGRLSAGLKKQLRRRNSKRASFSSPKTAHGLIPDSSDKLVSASGDNDDDDGHVVFRSI